MRHASTSNAQASSKGRWAARHLRPRRAQAGSIAITMGLFLLVGVILLESLALGYQFYTRRQMQNLADGAAMAGSATLTGSNVSCAPAVAAAKANAALNGKTASLTVDCGNWNPLYTTQYHYTAQSGTPTIDPNAVRVSVTGAVPWGASWLPGPNVGATAIAARTGPQVAVFSIASNLLCSPLLGVLCGSSTLNVNLTSLQLLNALGITNIVPNLTVAGFNNLLKTNKTTLSTLVTAIGSATGLTNLQAILTANAAVASLPINLLATADTAGLFTMDASDATTSTASAASLLNAKLNVADLLQVGASVANNKNAAATSVVVPGVTATISILQPPSIGIGGIGTSAHSATISLFLNITTDGTSGGNGLAQALAKSPLASTLGPLITLLTSTLNGVAKINLPIEIDLADSTAKITNMCTTRDASMNDLATFAVTTPIVRACVGGITQAGIVATSGAVNCSSGQIPSQTVLSLFPNLKPSPLLTLNAGFTIAALPNTGAYSLAAGGTLNTNSNSLLLGTTLANVAKVLATQLSLSLLPNTGSGSSAPNNNTTVASALFNTLGSSLSLATTTVQNGLSALNGLSTTASDPTTPAAPLASLLSGTTAVVTNLLASVTNLVGNILGGLLNLLLGSSSPLADKLANNTGSVNGGTVSNALLATIGLVANILQPALDAIGKLLADPVNGLFAKLGIDIGTANLKLISLNCVGTNVVLVQ